MRGEVLALQRRDRVGDLPREIGVGGPAGSGRTRRDEPQAEVEDRALRGIVGERRLLVAPQVNAEGPTAGVRGEQLADAVGDALAVEATDAATAAFGKDADDLATAQEPMALRDE
jgi:hypothetical protein